MAFATKGGAFVVKRVGNKTFFCSNCCGETGEGPILWYVYTRAEESSDAACSHRITGTGEGNFRTQTASQGDALAGVERHLATAGFVTYGCPTDVWTGCGDDSQSPWPTIAECCETGEKILFMGADRTDILFKAGPPAELSFTCSANDCGDRVKAGWSVKLYVTATQIIKGVNG